MSIVVISKNSHRYLAVMSLALGFLVVWSAVLAAVLVSRTVHEESLAVQSEMFFATQLDVGKMAFYIGHEMISTVNWIVSDPPDDAESDARALQVLWQITDGVLMGVRSNMAPTTAACMQILDNRLDLIRTSFSRNFTTPQQIVDAYHDVNTHLLRRALRFERFDVPVTSLAYTLFIRGMIYRFGELALGTVYIRSNLPVNETQYVMFKASSERLIEAAFEFVPRARSKWFELQEREPTVQGVIGHVTNDMLARQQHQRDITLTKEYLDVVKEQVAMLLLTKEVLNETIGEMRAETNRGVRQTLVFHAVICAVAAVALVVCVAVTALACRYLAMHSSSIRPPTQADTDRAHIVANPVIANSDTFKACYM